MNSILRKVVVPISAAITVSCIAVSPAQAQFGGAVFCTNCADKFSAVTQTAKQIETALNTARQLENQISQYQEMLKQGVSLPGQVFNQMTGSLQKLKQVYDTGKSIAGTAANFDQRFRQQFSSFDAYLAASGRRPPTADSYRRWSENGMDSMRVAMQSAGMNVNSIADDDAVLSQIIQRSQSASGRMQAIQAGNEIAAQQVQQLFKLRQMMNDQIQSQSTFYAQQIERQSADDAMLQRRFQKARHSPSKGF